MLIDMLTRYNELFRQASASKKYMEVVALQDKMNAELHENPPSSDDVLALLREVHKNPQMEVASSVFVAAWSNVCEDYVPVLCEIVMDERCKNWHEQAIKVLGELGNPHAIPALIAALDYRWDFDEWQSIPRKALHALAEVGTEQSITAIRDATNAEEEAIRKEAKELLEGCSS